MEKIVVFDFGGQTTQLIARRLREAGVYCEIYSGTDLPDKDVKNIKGFILSGSPYSVYANDAPFPNEKIFEYGVPILGICYGFQVLTKLFGGRVKKSEHQEFGKADIFFTQKNILFKNIPDGFTSWMSHGDSIEKLADGFDLIARTNKHPAAAYNSMMKIYGIQFHPEVSHCDYGTNILKNFAFEICHIKDKWNMTSYLKTIQKEIKSQVKDKNVLLLISGGVDSTVVAALLLRSLPPDQVYLMYIDTGLMRKYETIEVKKSIESLGGKNLQIIDASDLFLQKLNGVADPERKRQIIGDLFVEVQESELSDKINDSYFLAQGTLYTDMVESGKGVGHKSQVIKSHHNVRSPLIEKKREGGLVIEPVSMLFKDEVRSLGLILGVSPDIVNRHPFPGPGLGVRILGEVTRDKCTILREADYLFIKELKARGLYDKIWQAFCVLLPVKSVGVTGDSRKYGWTLAIRAVNSIDGMTADAFPFPSQDLLEISSLITNRIPDIGRVVYDVSSKPPATIEWE